MGLFIIDSGAENLKPLTWVRSPYDLRCGIMTLREKILKAYGQETCGLGTRDYLEEVYKEKNPGFKVNEVAGDSALVINGRVIFNADLAAKIPVEGADKIYKCGEEVVAARLSGDNLKAMKWDTPIEAASFPKLDEEAVEAKVVVYPWDLVHENAGEIEADFKLLAKPGVIEGKVYDGVHMIEKKNIYIAKGAKVKPGVVLDAEGGPIFIDEGATIFPNATIEGPAYIGKKSAIKIGAKIYEGTTIGEVCKIGGEVEESIIHSFSNKQHDGFLGHAYLGQWVNFGADTNNSDLKNDYGNVKVVVNGETINSGSMFVGCTVGDHTKTGINSMLNTGTVLGAGCNIFGAGLPPKYVPSFCWGGSDSLVEYRVDKCLQVAKAVMARRKLELSAAEEKMLRYVFEQTAAERKAAIA
jgi:UDP-N-acetylglucosamine diphosphorylase/glucosamine-1-phosphate N-acetyltransferase